ncbi:serine protease 3-like [Pieris brassicae]|uniref:serine protease 3-like n=1 Tax=Pieris brassicae TaxID=7116 RepID=UPI001E65F9F1|nr:serine protease 3-like [Pieris brassicae]
MAMKAACIILTSIVLVAIMAVCVMVKFATEITVEERKRDYYPGSGVYHVAKSIAVIALNENNSIAVSERFPYVAAIARNSSSTWSFACFASVVLVKWVVTSAHCRQKGATHRVLLLYDFARNVSTSYPILYWRIHEKYNPNSTIPFNDIAVAKFNIEYPLRSSTFDERPVTDVEASIWKTVATMDRRVYLINDFDRFPLKLASGAKCYETYGVQLDESLMCVDMSDYEDCFVHEFGPLYYEDKLVGVLALQPKDCEVKLAVFTNVSYYTTWVLKLTQTTFYG